MVIYPVVKLVLSRSLKKLILITNSMELILFLIFFLVLPYFSYQEPKPSLIICMCSICTLLSSLIISIIVITIIDKLALLSKDF